MRDLVLTLFLLGLVPFCLRSPTIGVFAYTWLSLMNPHRLTWGFAYDLPFAQLIAIATLVGIFFSREPKKLPVTSITVTLFLLVVWMNLSTAFAFEPMKSLAMWDKVMKIQFFVFVTLFVLYTKHHVRIFALIVTLSVAFFGVKGGVFTILGGGENRVYGPAGSFIEENNGLALATIMIIPLLRYLHLQATRRWQKWALLGAMVLCGFSALGSHSRGALLAIGAMVVFLWLKSRHKFMTSLLLVMLVPVAIGFMPDKWTDRMNTIENYQQDASAMGRINAWTMAWNLAKDRPLVGGGFAIYNERTFARYAPDPLDVHASHSIYFQMLGEHGFVGLGLFLLLWFLIWSNAAWVVRTARKCEGWQWAGDLAAMIQVSLVGYAVGGAFLGLAYFDLGYDLGIMVVMMRVLLEKEVKAQAATRPLPKGQAGTGPPAVPSRTGPALPGRASRPPFPGTRPARE